MNVLPVLQSILDAAAVHMAVGLALLVAGVLNIVFALIAPPEEEDDLKSDGEGSIGGRRGSLQAGRSDSEEPLVRSGPPPPAGFSPGAAEEDWRNQYPIEAISNGRREF